MQDLRKTMIDHTRYSTYLMLSIWKMGLFFGAACGVSIYYGLVREPKYVKLWQIAITKWLPLKLVISMNKVISISFFCFRNLFNKFKGSFLSHNYTVNEVMQSRYKYHHISFRVLRFWGCIFLKPSSTCFRSLT